MKTTTAALVVLITFLSSQVLAQAPARDYLSKVESPVISNTPDGRIAIVLDASSGDLRGMLSLLLTEDVDGVKGTWTFDATWLEDLRADGTPIAQTDHVDHDHDNPDTPAVHREYTQLHRDGGLVGAVTSAKLVRTPDGRITGIEAAELVITGGARNYKSATGSGRLGAWPSLPDALTLLLSF